MEEKEYLPIIRNYKDTLFRMLFRDKENLLSLYNLMSDKHYMDPDMLTIVTLDNAIYMNMKNDLAFLIDCTICMYEHQSTLSPNLPLRNLFYIAREYEKLTNDATLYSSKRITIPAPCFVVFYNGYKTDWTIRSSRLSESFLTSQDSPNLELVVKEININLGTNDNTLAKCKPLFEYMQYIEKVRTYTASMPTAVAVDKAVKECIQKGILGDFLLRYRSEAIQMSIFEFDEEKEMKLIRADEREIGHAKGLAEGYADATRKAVIRFIQFHLAQKTADNIILQQAIHIFDLSSDQIKLMIQEVRM